MTSDITGNYDLSTREGFFRRADETTRKRIPPRFRDATATDERVIAWSDSLVGAYRAGTTAVPLLISGTTGVGKTHQAFGAIRRIAASGIVIGWLATNTPDLFARLRPRDDTDTEAEFRRWSAVPLLLLDDLGAAKDSEWTEEVTYRLVNHRSASLLPSIYTTNLQVRSKVPGERTLESAMSERVFSRLAECTVVMMKGPDRRLLKDRGVRPGAS
jgi:DNA replication protein DnaC